LKNKPCADSRNDVLLVYRTIAKIVRATLERCYIRMGIVGFASG
jgi:hypothetical protein